MTVLDQSRPSGAAETLALLAAVVLVGSNAFVLSPILPDVARGLDAEPFRVAWAISALGAATAMSAFALASLVDRMPARWVLGGAALLMGVAEAASGASRSYLWLCLSQALAGVGAGVLLPGAYAIAVTTAAPGREAARLGIVLTGWSLSLVFAVPLAAIVTERFGWRAVYAAIAGMAVVTALCLATALQGVRNRSTTRTAAWHAARLPGVAALLTLVFAYMTAFYGSFAFFGEGLRNTFGLSAEGAAIFDAAYGVGFGLAGMGLGTLKPRISRSYITLVLIAIALSYATWGLALDARPAALLAALVWGFLNQLGLNALVVSLTRRSADARGAVMGLNSTVTYLALFAGPVVMGPVYAGWGLVGVMSLAAAIVSIGALLSSKIA